MVQRKSAFNLATCARPNILSLKPYRCARDDYKDNGTNILLDANENAFGPCLDLGATETILNDFSTDANVDNSTSALDFSKLNRYPDPHQIELKLRLGSLRNTHAHTKQDIRPENLFVGVGSDEAIDAILRCFCAPGRDKVLICPPTYGMYTVCADINDLAVVKVPLDTKTFQLRPTAINETLAKDPSIKVVFACSPGNPTGQLLRKTDIQAILEHPTWNGLVVLDEAYIDFSADEASLAEWVLEWPNLVVMQTLSKAFGLAGIRLGAAFASREVAQLLNNLKAPYNISSPTSVLARAGLQPGPLARMRQYRTNIIDQRNILLRKLPQILGVGDFLGGQDANFLLVQILDRSQQGKPCNEVALAVYERLAELQGVVVRFRGKEHGCSGALRITVGTELENERLLNRLEEEIKTVYACTQKASGNVDGASESEMQKQEMTVLD